MAIDIVTAIFIASVAGGIYLSTLWVDLRPCRRLRSSAKQRRVALAAPLKRSHHQL
jgi:hypothetical protein